MKCPICAYSPKSDFIGSFLPKTYYCSHCGVHFIKDPKIATYTQKYYRNTNSQTSISSVAHPFLKILTEIKMKQIMNIVKNTKNPRILDYGCGAGEIVKNLSKHGFDISGFEPSRGAFKINQSSGLPITNDLRKIKGKFDLIMMWHSLEHINNPVLALRKIKNMLTSHGRLLIAVPNVDSIEAKLSKENWFHYTFPEHRFYYSPKSLTYLLNKLALKVENIDYLNFEYTSTGLAQTVLNMIYPKDVLYSLVSKRRRTMKKDTAQLLSYLSLITLIVLSPVLLIFYLIQLFFRKTGAIVVTAK